MEVRISEKPKKTFHNEALIRPCAKAAGKSGSREKTILRRKPRGSVHLRPQIQSVGWFKDDPSAHGFKMLQKAIKKREKFGWGRRSFE